VQRKRAFERRADAERFLVEVAADLARGAYVDPRAGRTTVREYAEGWRAAQVHRATTAAQVETHLRRHVYPMFGDRALASVRPSEVQAWVRGLEQHLAPATIEVVYSFLAGIFRAAVRDRLLVISPCVDVRLPKPEPKRVEPLATEKVEALIEAMPARYRALIVLAAGTGLRQGEAFGMELETVDFLRRTLEVRQQLVTMPGKAPYLAPPKTPASYRTVPLPQVVIDALAAHLAAFPAVPVEITDATVRPEPKRRRAALIFTTRAGLPIRRTRFSTIWRPAAATAELGDGVTFHDLRHLSPRCSSGTASRSRPCSAGSATPPPRRPWTPTRTCGPTPTTGRVRRSTPCSAQPRHRGPTTTKGERRRRWARRTPSRTC
jgi:integrase